MATRHFLPLIGHEQQLREWLGFGDHPHLRDPSLHDLLGLKESCRDAEEIKARSIERAAMLRSLEAGIQRTGDPAVIGLLNHLQRYISSAERLLCDPKYFKEYAKEVIEHRSAQFLKYLRRHYDPADPLSDEARRTLIQAGGEHRLPTARTEEILAEFFREEEEESLIPETYRDHVKWLKIRPYLEDPMWPTHLDILGLEEGQPVDGAVLRQAEADQLAKIPDLARHPDVEKRRRAEMVRQQVQNAAKNLAADPGAYIETCRKRRTTKFKGVAKEHQRLRGDLTTEGRGRLVRDARGLRLAEPDAELVIDEVFLPGGKEPDTGKRRPPPPPPPPPPPLPAVDIPPIERYGSAAAVVGGLVALPALFALAVSRYEAATFVFGMIAWFTWPMGVLLLERLWGHRRLTVGSAAITCLALFFVWAVFGILDWSVGRLLRAVLDVALPGSLAAMIVGGIAGALMGASMAFTLTGDNGYKDDECGQVATWLAAAWGIGCFFGGGLNALTARGEFLALALGALGLAIGFGKLLQNLTSPPNRATAQTVGYLGVAGTAVVILAGLGVVVAVGPEDSSRPETPGPGAQQVRPGEQPAGPPNAPGTATPPPLQDPYPWASPPAPSTQPGGRVRPTPRPGASPRQSRYRGVYPGMAPPQPGATPTQPPYPMLYPGMAPPQPGATPTQPPYPMQYPGMAPPQPGGSPSLRARIGPGMSVPVVSAVTLDYRGALQINLQRGINLPVVRSKAERLHDVWDCGQFLVWHRIGAGEDRAYIFGDGQVIIAGKQPLDSFAARDRLSNEAVLVTDAVAQVDGGVKLFDRWMLYSPRFFGEKVGVYKALNIEGIGQETASIGVQVPNVEVKEARLLAFNHQNARLFGEYLLYRDQRVGENGDISQWLRFGNQQLKLTGGWSRGRANASVRLEAVTSASDEHITATAGGRTISSSIPCDAIGQLKVPEEQHVSAAKPGPRYYQFGAGRREADLVEASSLNARSGLALFVGRAVNLPPIQRNVAEKGHQVSNHDDQFVLWRGLDEAGDVAYIFPAGQILILSGLPLDSLAARDRLANEAVQVTQAIYDVDPEVKPYDGWLLYEPSFFAEQQGVYKALHMAPFHENQWGNMRLPLDLPRLTIRETRLIIYHQNQPYKKKGYVLLDGNPVPDEGEVKQWLSFGSHLLEMRGNWRDCSARLEVFAAPSPDSICAAVEDHYVTDAVPCSAIGQLVVPKIAPGLPVASSLPLPEKPASDPAGDASAGDRRPRLKKQPAATPATPGPAEKSPQEYQPRKEGKVVGQKGRYVVIDLGKRDNLVKDMIVEVQVRATRLGARDWRYYKVFRVLDEESRLELYDKRLGDAQPGDPVRIKQAANSTGETRESRSPTSLPFGPR